MHVQVKKPSPEILAAYYDLWFEGLSAKVLATRLLVMFPDLGPGGTPRARLASIKAYLAKHLPTLHSYCRTRFRGETETSLRDVGTPAAIPLTDDRRAELLDYVGHGATLPKAADLLNVPLVTITELWCRDDPGLKTELSCVRDRHDLQVVAALKRRAVGYDLPYSETRTSTEEGSNDKIGVTNKTVETTVSGVKHYPGSVPAQVHWTRNRLGWVDAVQGDTGDQNQVEYDIRERLYDEEVT